MDTFDSIAAHGNTTTNGVRNNRITCKDGFSLSVVAGPGMYCRPRPAIGAFLTGDDVPENYLGPYTEVEVGFPSERPEPWHCHDWHEGWDRHADHAECNGWQVRSDNFDGEDNWDTVYGYVPVAVVRALIDSHGGEA